MAAAVLAQEPPVQEHVTVNLVELTVHASDPSGEPVRDLKASDFRVLVDGAAVEIESLEWSGTLETEGVPAPTAPGRLMVLMFQWEIQAQKAEGHMRMSRQALEFVDTLEPGDRVAVLAFGSRLWLRQDFTSDHALLRSAILNVLVARRRAGQRRRAHARRRRGGGAGRHVDRQGLPRARPRAASAARLQGDPVLRLGHRQLERAQRGRAARQDALRTGLRRSAQGAAVGAGSRLRARHQRRPAPAAGRALAPRVRDAAATTFRPTTFRAGR